MQAARGTSVDRRPTRLRLLFAAVALTAYAVDVGTKILAVERLEGRPDVQVIGEVLQLHLTFNPGAAFSTGQGLTPLISLVAIGASLAVLWYSRRIGSAVWAVGLGFLLAGITGNLTDRIFREPGPLRGHVVDFLRLPNWPIFNVADICINVAAGLIIIQAVRGIHLDGSRDRDQADQSDKSDHPDETTATDADVLEEKAE